MLTNTQVLIGNRIEISTLTEDGSRETTIHSNEANKVIIGSPDPKLTGGLTNFVSWKFIDLNFTLITLWAVMHTMLQNLVYSLMAVLTTM